MLTKDAKKRQRRSEQRSQLKFKLKISDGFYFTYVTRERGVTFVQRNGKRYTVAVVVSLLTLQPVALGKIWLLTKKVSHRLGSNGGTDISNIS